MYNTENFNFYVFLQYLGVTALVFTWFFRRLRTLQLRLLFGFYVGGYFFYSGIGAAYESGVAKEYFFFYVLYILVFAFSFRIASLLLLNVQKQVGEQMDAKLGNFFTRKYALYATLSYLALSLFPLIYPSFDLGKIFSPPSLNIASVFFDRFDGQKETDILTVIATYLEMLLFPFYLLSLNYYKRNSILVAFLILFPLYLDFVSTGYVGRSQILIRLVLLFLVLWRLRPDLRRKMTTSLAILIPFLLIFSYYFRIVRVGDTADITSINLTDAYNGLVGVETAWPTTSAQIMDAEVQGDMGAYLKWLFTIPIPKFLLDKGQEGLVGYEISEYLLGKGRNQAGFNVLLYGNVTESVYIYGKALFWLQPLIIGFLLAFLGRFLGRSQLLYPAFVYILLLCGYNLTRAGTQSAFPVIINFNMVFFLYAIWVAKKKKYRFIKPISHAKTNQGIVSSA